MSKPSDRAQYILILMGEEFDEAVATIFTTVFREAGLRVKLVGLHGQRAKGRHGLTLFADLTFEQALPLAKVTDCIVIPGHLNHFQRYQNDPRLANFMAEAHAHSARFMIGRTQQTLALSGMIFPATLDFEIYPNLEDLPKFAQEVACSF